jgi:hypothetical protein
MGLKMAMASAIVETVATTAGRRAAGAGPAGVVPASDVSTPVVN